MNVNEKEREREKGKANEFERKSVCEGDREQKREKNKQISE